MNYYNSQALIAPNGKPYTILPLEAFNDYQQEFISTFNECSEARDRINFIINLSTHDETYPSTSSDNSETSSDESTNVEPAQSLTSEPLPSLESNEPDHSLELLMTHLHNVSTVIDNYDEFIEHIRNTYGVDLTTPFYDLPFPVIDEILTFLDYDPDESTQTMDEAFNTFQKPNIIIKRELMTDFQNQFNRFTFNLKMLKHLDSMNGITNERTDDEYNGFQCVFKPSQQSLIELYTTAQREYERILNTSLKHYHIIDVLAQINWDAEYSDHDW